MKNLLLDDSFIEAEDRYKPFLKTRRIRFSIMFAGICSSKRDIIWLAKIWRKEEGNMHVRGDILCS